MQKQITYQTGLENLEPSSLGEGFFEGWSNPMSQDKHFQVLKNSSHIVLAMDGEKVIGFINALSDGVHAAFISLIEVLPAYRGYGIGSQLMHRMLEELKPYSCIDLMCDPPLQDFYEHFSMLRSHGMVIRKYLKP